MKNRFVIFTVIAFVVAGVLIGGFLFLRQKQAALPVLDKAKIEFIAAEGKILSIGQNTLNIVVPTLESADQEATTGEKVFSFRLANTSKVFLETDEAKSEDEFNQEQAKFKQLLAMLSENGEPAATVAAPGWYKLKEAQFADLREGSKVQAYLTLALQNAAEPTAAKIVIMRTAAVIPPAGGKDIFEVKGTLREVKQGVVKVDAVKAEPERANKPGYKPVVESIEINLVEQTAIYSQTKKSEEEFNKEQEVFMRQLNPDSGVKQNIAGLAAPDWYLKKTLARTDLQVGAQVTVRGYRQEGKLIAEEIVLE